MTFTAFFAKDYFKTKKVHLIWTWHSLFEDAYMSTNKLIPHDLPHYFIFWSLRIIILCKIYSISISALIPECLSSVLSTRECLPTQIDGYSRYDHFRYNFLTSKSSDNTFLPGWPCKLSLVLFSSTVNKSDFLQMCPYILVLVDKSPTKVLKQVSRWALSYCLYKFINS